MKEVVSVYQSNPRKYSLYTTRSWEFLGLEQGETKPIKANSYSGGKKKGKAGRFHELDLPIPQLFQRKTKGEKKGEAKKDVRVRGKRKKRREKSSLVQCMGPTK